MNEAAYLILNEWVWHDLRGDNGPPARQQTARFIIALVERADGLCVVMNSAFTQKCFSACKSQLLVDRRLAGAFKNLLFDSTRCVQIPIADLLPLDPALAARVNPDDHYLVQAQLKLGSAKIVTTDGMLIKVMIDCGVPCEHRDIFLTSYLAR